MPYSAAMKSETMWRFIKFSLVGALALLLDGLVFLALQAVLINTASMDQVMGQRAVLSELWLCRVLAFWCAASFTWLGNRYLTFSAGSGSALRQWGRHMLSCHIAGAVNLGCFALLTLYTTPLAALVCGAIAGMLFNYTLARRWVFTAAE